MSLSRREFLKGAAVGTVGIASAGVLAGCSPTVLDETGSSEAEVVSYTSPTDGKYLTTAKGHGDIIYVLTEFRNGEIVACKVVAHKETIGIGSYACERIPAAILANQSVNVPNVRGCSNSSRAVKKAVEEAIRISGHDIANFSTEVIEPDNNTSEEKTVDVVVMGSGTAGLVCAAKLLDQGYSVLVVEKRGIPGGTMAMTYSGVIVSETPTLANYDVDESLPGYLAKIDGMVAYYSNLVDPETDRFNATVPYERQAYTALADMSEWFKDIGIGFLTLGSFEGATKLGAVMYLSPGIYMGGSGYAMMALASRIERHPNGEILYMTKVTELTQDPDTKQVSGLKAVGLKSDDSENGYELNVNAKAVVLASGGFARNKEMLEQYYPENKDYYFNCASASTGDGTQLGLAAGSSLECVGRKLPAYLSAASYVELVFLRHSTPGIMVNATGKNIGNISKDTRWLLDSALRDESNGGRFFYIFDESGVPSTKNFVARGFNAYASMFRRDEVLHYKSVDEMAADLSLPDLQAAIDANNAASLAGEPDEFGRTNCPFIDTRNGIYAIDVIPTNYNTTGGICIDLDGRVITEPFNMDGENTVIPGLYACGDVAGSIEEKDGRVYTMGFDMAMGYGYTVAHTIESDEVSKSS